MTQQRRRVLVILHEDLMPPESTEGLSPAEIAPFRTEYDVVTGLRTLGHEVLPVGISEELAPLRQALADWKPHITFNLLEGFRNLTILDHAVVSYLELMRQPYTGSNPRGLILARDKALSKKILHYHRLPVPAFMMVRRGRKVRRRRQLEFPLIVKSLIEDASTGISQASVVHNDEKLVERVQFIHRSVGTDAIVESYIPGREIYSSVLGNQRLQVLPPWELFIDNLPPHAPRIATERVKWDLEYQKKIGLAIGPAEVSEEIVERIKHTSKRIYRRLDMSGYARIDYRLTESNELVFLEANPNPDIAFDEEFASAAEEAGYEYPQMLQRILNLGLAAARS